MNTPVPELMKQYGTEDVFLSKTADAVPLLARLGASILNYKLVANNDEKAREQRLEDELRYEAVREHELAKMRPATENLRHTHAPMFLPAGSDVPVGYDEGMVRLASIATGVGADMAKEAGLGDFANFAKTMVAKVPGALKGLVNTTTSPTGAASTGLIGGAKRALTGGLGLKTNLALGAAAVGGTMLASKAMGATGRAMSREQEGPPVYGGAVRGVGYQLPFGVNQYGQPQVGSPLG